MAAAAATSPQGDGKKPPPLLRPIVSPVFARRPSATRRREAAGMLKATTPVTLPSIDGPMSPSRNGFASPTWTGGSGFKSRSMPELITTPWMPKERRLQAFVDRQMSHATIEARRKFSQRQMTMVDDRKKEEDVMFYGSDGKAGFRRYLVTKFGSVLSGWRELDLDGNGRLTWMEFCKALRRMSFHGSLKVLWKELAVNDTVKDDGETFKEVFERKVSMKDICEEAAFLIGTFKGALMRRYGDMLTAWQKGLDVNGTGRIEEREVAACCQRLGVHLDTRKLWLNLRVCPGEKPLGMTLKDFDPDAHVRYVSGDTQGFMSQGNTDVIGDPLNESDVSFFGQGGAAGGVAKWRQELSRRSLEEVEAARYENVKMKKGLFSATGFKDALINRCGSLFGAWRRALDLDDNGRITFGEFCHALERLGFHGHITELWGELDMYNRGYLLFEDLDPWTDRMFKDFKQKLTARYDNMLLGWLKGLDKKGIGRIDVESFVKACAKIGFETEKEARYLFKMLQPETGRSTISLQDLDIRAYNALSRGDFRMISEPPKDKLFKGKTKLEMNINERTEVSTKIRLQRARAFAERSAYAKACNMADRRTSLPPGVEQFNDLCIRKYGSLAAAWRMCLDLDNNGRLTFGELCNALRLLGYRGNYVELWTTLDVDETGFVSLREVDSESADMLEDFLKILLVYHRDIHQAWKAGFKKDPNHGIDLPTLDRMCKAHNYMHKAEDLFRVLQPDPYRKTFGIWELEPLFFMYAKRVKSVPPANKLPGPLSPSPGRATSSTAVVSPEEAAAAEEAARAKEAAEKAAAAAEAKKAEEDQGLSPFQKELNVKTRELAEERKAERGLEVDAARRLLRGGLLNVAQEGSFGMLLQRPPEDALSRFEAQAQDLVARSRQEKKALEQMKPVEGNAQRLLRMALVGASTNGSLQGALAEPGIRREEERAAAIVAEAAAAKAAAEEEERQKRAAEERFKQEYNKLLEKLFLYMQKHRLLPKDLYNQIDKHRPPQSSESAIDLKELTVWCKAHLDLPEDDAARLFKRLDRNRNGLIGYKEWVAEIEKKFKRWRRGHEPPPSCSSIWGNNPNVLRHQCTLALDTPEDLYHAAVKGMSKRWGSTLAAWRLDTDRQNKGFATRGNLLLTLEKFGFAGNQKLLWEALSGQQRLPSSVTETGEPIPLPETITFRDFDPFTQDRLDHFRNELVTKCGSVQGFWRRSGAIQLGGQLHLHDWLAALKANNIEEEDPSGLFRLFFVRLGQQALELEDLDALLIGVPANSREHAIPDVKKRRAEVWGYNTEDGKKPPTPRQRDIIQQRKDDFRAKDIRARSLEGFLKLLRQKFGGLYAAWRQVLDLDQNGLVTYQDFTRACQHMGFYNVKELWQELDAKEAGQVFFMDYYPELTVQFQEFERLLISQFGHPKDGWRKIFGVEKTGFRCEKHTFVEGCARLGYSGDAEHLFQELRPELGRQFVYYEDIWTNLNPNDFERKGHVRDYKSVLGSHGEPKPPREPNPWTQPIEVDSKLFSEWADATRIRIFRYVDKHRLSLQALFREINKDRRPQKTDSVISPDELALWTEALGISLQESDQLFIELDANESGAIEYNEWVADMGPKITHWRRRKKAIQKGLVPRPQGSDDSMFEANESMINTAHEEE
eukprot:TRINITY_DN29455_c0_g1_i1.p1 TRINITY_DN29455_c0_g1~~TRINITY_DN29455_c0_g1_i1.p1  ORF type:complete len:1646 (-),score=514.46 TRINITY_DN29455_c0_g1_i1:127-5064(-)